MPPVSFTSAVNRIAVIGLSHAVMQAHVHFGPGQRIVYVAARFGTNFSGIDQIPVFLAAFGVFIAAFQSVIVGTPHNRAAFGQGEVRLCIFGMQDVNPVVRPGPVAAGQGIDSHFAGSVGGAVDVDEIGRGIMVAIQLGVIDQCAVIPLIVTRNPHGVDGIDGSIVLSGKIDSAGVGQVVQVMGISVAVWVRIAGFRSVQVQAGAGADGGRGASSALAFSSRRRILSG